MTKQSSKLSKINPLAILPYVIAAAISLAIGVIVFKAKEIAPFGSRSVLCMDLWGQYFPMYVNNVNAGSLSEILHSWNGAFGYNNWVQSAYYCNSIFILLMKFIPAAKLVKALDIFCLIKIALSSVTCLGALRYKTKSQSPALIGAAVCYSLCSYMIAFISQFMWTDALIYTPLVIIGIEKLIHERKPLLYVITLAATIISSFYIGFAVCIFSAFYFLTHFLLCIRLTKNEETQKHRIVGFGDALISCVRFGIYSLIAGALSAAVIIPVYMGITNTLASEATGPEKLEWYGNFTQVLQYALPSQGFFQEYTGANIYCGLLVFLAVPLYFTNKAVRIPERILSAFMLVFLTASMNCNYLNYVWHGFHFPNQLPGRWVFLFSLYLILLTGQGLANYKGLTIIRTVLGSGAGIALFYFTVKGLGKTEKYEDLPSYAWPVIIASAAVIVVGSVIAFIIRNKPDKAKNILWHICTAAVACMMVFDIGKNLLTISKYEGNKGFQAADEVTYTEQLVRHLNNGKRISSGKNDFYRVEANGGSTFNPSMIDNCKGMGYYSSTMNGKAFTSLKYMGNRVYADKVSSVYNISSPVQNSLFGLKYFIDYGGSLSYVLPGTVVKETAAEETPAINENTTALPIAYAVSDNILSFQTDDQIRGLENHNRLLSALCGAETTPYIKVEPDKVDPVNVRLDEGDDLNSRYYYVEDGSATPNIIYEYTAPKSGFYFLSHNFRAGSLHITAFNLDRNFETTNGAFTYCGRLDEGGQMKIEFKAENLSMGCHGLEVYYIDEQVWDMASKQLKSGGLKVTEATGTKIKGDVELDHDSLMLMTAVQDGGWNIYCDGKKLETMTAADIFPVFRVPSGKHQIVMKYSVPGLKPGLIISISGLGALIIMLLLTAKLRKKAAGKAETETEKKDETKEEPKKSSESDKKDAKKNADSDEDTDEVGSDEDDDSDEDEDSDEDDSEKDEDDSSDDENE
ncbi:MAG: YfhO family protein [Ruminococcus sp.]|nr:YfhO family protein [Ruminococcus sp.]